MKQVVAVVALPPPIHGQSLVNKAIVDRIACLTDVKLSCFDISPGGLDKGFFYHFNRLRKVAFAVFSILFNFANFRGANFYFVYESGLGVIYNFLLVAAARCLQGNIFFHHHTSFHAFDYKKTFGFLSCLLGSDATHVVLSERMAFDLSRIYELKKVCVLTNSRFVKSPALLSAAPVYDGFVIGFISNLMVQKGTLVTFDLFRKLYSVDSRFKLFLAGPVVENDVQVELDVLLKDFPLNVIYFGPVSGQEKNDFFASLDFFVFPSIYKFEAQPLVVIEALSFGVPCFVTPQGYTGELIERLGGKFVIPVDLFVEKVSAGILDYLSNINDYYILRSQCRALFVEKQKNSNLEFDGFVSLISNK